MGVHHTALTDGDIHAADNREWGGATVSGGDVQCVLPTILLPSIVNYEVALQSVEETALLTAIQIDNTYELVHPYPLQPQGDGIGMAVIMAFLQSEQESDLLTRRQVMRYYCAFTSMLRSQYGSSKMNFSYILPLCCQKIMFRSTVELISACRTIRLLWRTTSGEVGNTSNSGG